MRPENKSKASTVSVSLLLFAAAIVVNSLLFGIYRLALLSQGAGLSASADTARVLLYGLRLDLALLGFELCGLGLLTLMFRRLQVRWMCRWLWGLTALHAGICLANFYSFAERSQDAGGLLLPYITSPYQVWLAVLPFIQQHWLLMLAVGLVAAIYFWFGIRFSRRLEAARAPVDLWQSPKIFSLAFVVAVLPLMMTWQAKTKRRLTADANGFTPVFANSKFYTHFTNIRENEAVINPLFEFVGVQIPGALRNKIHYRLTETEALKEWQEHDGSQTDARYPLLRMIQGHAQSKIENVVIIQVEGFTGSIMQQERKGRPVTPFLRKLAKDGIYFPNAFQNANFTSGGVFSTATSVPKAAWEETTRRFASHELRGYYGSLARTLGGNNYTHYFCEGFRQSGDDFLTFMAYQGSEVLNYPAFRSRIKAKQQLADADSLLGIHDGYVMQEMAETLGKCSTRFTAHLMTSTTHSPWAVPPSFQSPFEEPDLNTFAYLDASIEAFVKWMERTPGLAEKTLLVVLGDHTSIRFGNNLLERFRIPLIFYAPGLARVENAETIWASQVDVLPTILGLMSGKHRYAGMGRDLLDESWKLPGIVSGTPDMGYFLTPEWVLQYRPFGGESAIFAVSNGVAAPQNVVAENPGVLKRLTRQCFSRIELARRLGRDRRVYPMNSEDRPLTSMAPN